MRTEKVYFFEHYIVHSKLPGSMKEIEDVVREMFKLIPSRGQDEEESRRTLVEMSMYCSGPNAFKLSHFEQFVSVVVYAPYSEPRKNEMGALGNVRVIINKVSDNNILYEVKAFFY